MAYNKMNEMYHSLHNNCAKYYAIWGEDGTYSETGIPNILSRYRVYPEEIKELRDEIQWHKNMIAADSKDERIVTLMEKSLDLVKPAKKK